MIARTATKREVLQINDIKLIEKIEPLRYLVELTLRDGRTAQACAHTLDGNIRDLTDLDGTELDYKVDETADHYVPFYIPESY